MLIRRARIDDAEDISKLCAELNVTRSSSARTGFVEHAPSPEEFRRRIIGNPLFFTAYEHHELAGFVAAYRDDRMPEEDITKALDTKERPFVYCELLGVKEGYRGLGKILVQYLFDHSRGPYWSATVCAPRRNRPAEALLRLTGWKPEQKVESDGLTFQFYRHE
jgi:GNAT superfamily N-acetyltransferase